MRILGVGPARRLFRPVSLSSHVASGSGPDQIAIWPGVTFGSYYGLREDSLRHLLVRRLAYANLPYVASLFRTEPGGLAFFAAGTDSQCFRFRLRLRLTHAHGQAHFSVCISLSSTPVPEASPSLQASIWRCPCFINQDGSPFQEQASPWRA